MGRAVSVYRVGNDGSSTDQADTDEIGAASEQGRICALAAKGQRDLQRVAAVHRDLFAGKPFDPALFSTVSLATAFGAPWCTAEQLRASNRAALWVFAADWRIDYLAKRPEDVHSIVSRCQTVAAGGDAAPDDALSRFLAELRDELATVPAFESLREAWRDEVDRMMTAMAREWEWKSSRADGLPTFADYLDNADNFGSSFVNLSHWIYTGDPATLAHLPDLMRASAEVQRMLRLINDLATHQRDVEWGDLNALMLTAGRAEVTDRIRSLIEHCRQLIGPLTLHCPRQAAYLNRQIGYSSGFYQVSDFWGTR